MVGIGDYERVDREHALLCATASPEVLAEAKCFADFVFEARGWGSHAPGAVKVQQDRFNEYLQRASLLEALEKSYGSDYNEDPSTPAGADGRLPSELTFVEINRKQQFPLTEACLQQADCECHGDLPELFARASSPTPHDVMDIDVPPSGRDGTAGTPERDGDSMPSGEKGKSVERGRVAVSDAYPHSDVDSVHSQSEAGPSTRASRTMFSNDFPAPGQESTSVFSLLHSVSQTHQPEYVEHHIKSKGPFPCRWKERFGGGCTYISPNPQSHDRHIATHLPDDHGYEITQFKCTLCGIEFPRFDSCDRHAKQRHGHKKDEPLHCVSLPCPWWWPVDLFVSSCYRNMPRAPEPHDNTRNWDQRIREVIARHSQVVTKPYRLKRSSAR